MLETIRLQTMASDNSKETDLRMDQQKYYVQHEFHTLVQGEPFVTQLVSSHVDWQCFGLNGTRSDGAEPLEGQTVLR